MTPLYSVFPPVLSHNIYHLKQAADFVDISVCYPAATLLKNLSHTGSQSNGLHITRLCNEDTEK